MGESGLKGELTMKTFPVKYACGHEGEVDKEQLKTLSGGDNSVLKRARKGEVLTLASNCPECGKKEATDYLQLG